MFLICYTLFLFDDLIEIIRSKISGFVICSASFCFRTGQKIERPAASAPSGTGACAVVCEVSAEATVSASAPECADPGPRPRLEEGARWRAGGTPAISFSNSRLCGCA